jgi:hypothetical protein
MLRRVIPTLVVWIVILIALDLPSVMAVSGVVVALLLAWWEERKELAERAEAEAENDRFEETPLFYV